MTYSLVSSTPISSGDTDQWFEVPQLFSKPNQIIRYVSSTIPQSWETLGRIFQATLNGNINDFVLSERWRHLFPLQPNGIDWETGENEVFKLYLRLHPYTKPGVLEVWESDVYLGSANSNGGSSVVAWGDITGNKNYTDLAGLPDLTVYQLTDNAFDGNYNSLSNLPSLFSGDYADLTNKPEWTESTEITYATNTTILIPHGLGSVPKEWHVILRCKVANAGYSVGDEIPVDWKWANAYQGMGVYANATNIAVIAMAGTQLLINPTTKTGAAMTPASWRIVARWKP